jgi:hypothetical protein
MSRSCSVENQPPQCTAFVYSDWSECNEGEQTRSVISTTPAVCTGGSPLVSQVCEQTCTENNGWECTSWGACSADGKQVRTCERCKENPGTPPTQEKQCVYDKPNKTLFDERDVVIKRAGNNTLYYLAEDGRRYVFPTAAVYKSWFREFVDIFEVADDQLFELPLAGNITYRPGVKMVKVETDPKVYAVAPGGILRWITSEALAENLYGEAWNKNIDDIPDAFFTNYEMGPDIASLADFNPTEIAKSVASVNDDKEIPRSTNARMSDTQPNLGVGRGQN